jgi:hypothetical protein
MKKIISMIAIMAIICTTMVLLTGCGEENTINNNRSGSYGVDNFEVIKGDPLATFKSLGVDLEKVKPNVGTPDDSINYSETINVITDIIYYSSAAWYEAYENVSIEEGHKYNEKMFEYIKSISDDNNIYKNYSNSNYNPDVVNAYDDLEGIMEGTLGTTWSYRYNDKWIDVYMEYSGIDTEKGKIGIMLQGAGYYSEDYINGIIEE